jgi:hypothetical protein
MIQQQEQEKEEQQQQSGYKSRASTSCSRLKIILKSEKYRKNPNKIPKK